eukprot:349668_1
MSHVRGKKAKRKVKNVAKDANHTSATLAHTITCVVLNKNKKAKSMTVETLLALLAFVALLYPMGAEAHNWNGTDLLSATLAHTITLQPGRSATEFCKRSWENDVNFGVDLGGKYCIFREAMNTKTLNTSDANQNRISEKIYQRADRKGLYSLLSEYSKVRPRQSDIDESQKRKK